MRGEQAARVHRLRGVIGPEHVVHHHHAPVAQRADADLLAAAGGQRVRPVERPRSQLVDVEPAGAELEQAAAEPVAGGPGIALDETDVFERTQDALRGRLGETERVRDLLHFQPVRTGRQQPEHGRRAFDGLDQTRHVRHCRTLRVDPALTAS
nr:hypothetical protein GCM10020092_030370 [Actinoplanes digitatis]